MAEEGRALLRNFRLRQQLKLLPRSQPIGIGTAGTAGTAGTVSLKRLEELLSHRAFGYESESFESFEAANVTLNDARKTTLQGQLQDLNATKEAEMLQFQEVEMAAQSLQQEMAKMVDEHEALTRQRYELWARQKELADETLRLQAVLADLDSNAQVKNDQPESEGNRSLAKTAERLKLHHLHLQRLLEEQKLLQQQLGSAEHMALQR